MSNYNSILIFKNYIVNKVEYNNNPNFNGDEKGTPINLKIKHIIDINKRSMNVTLITEIFENNSKKNKLVDSLHIAGNLELFGIEIKILNEEEQGFSKIMIKSRKDVIYTIKGTLNLQAYDKRFAGSLKMRKEEKNEGSTILSEAN